MKTIAGLWIDHREAIIVTISDIGEKVHHIQSNVEKQQGRLDGVRSVTSYESQLVQADNRQQRRFTKHIDAFYDKVFSCLGNAESVLIFGPGEAKGELEKIIRHNNHQNPEVVIKSADKMTDRQIAVKVHDYFTSKKLQFHLNEE